MSTPLEIRLDPANPPGAPDGYLGAATPAPHLRLAPPLDQPPLDQPPLDTPEVDFEDFVRRYEMRLRRLVLRRLGDSSEAQEIAQETLLRAYQHRASFSAEQELIAWCTVVAQRLVIDRARVRGRSIAVADVPENARLGRDTAEIVVARQEARAALDALEAIPSRQAAILWAREVEGLHYDEIAQRFAISEPAVRSLLHRGRRALRKEYLARGHTLPVAGLVPLAPWLLPLRRMERLRGITRRVLRPGTPLVSALTLAGIAVFAVGWGPLKPGGSDVQMRRLPATTFGAAHQTAVVPAAATHSATRAERGAGALSSRPVAIDDLPPLLKHVPKTCVATHEGTSSPTLLGGTPAHISNGSHGGCAAVTTPEDNSSTIYVNPMLPENPTGVRQVYVTNDQVHCGLVPNNAVTTCEGPTGQHPKQRKATSPSHLGAQS